MKKNLFVVTMGIAFVLTACGQTASDDEITTGSVTVISEDRPATSDGAVVVKPASNLNSKYLEDSVLSTEYITLTMPNELKDLYYATIEDETISIFDKSCVDAGFPGFVFSVMTDKNQTIIPGFMHTKVGEVETEYGIAISVLRGYASEVQWDYNNEEPESYTKLDDAAESIIENIQGANGNTFVYKGGTKGEELYSEEIAQYVKAVNLGWGVDEYEEAGLSPEFAALFQTEGDRVLDKIGFAYADITNDGVDELLMGIITDEDGPTPVYDVYTTVNGVPAHVASGTSQSAYYALEYGGIANFFTEGDEESGVISYIIEPGSTNLFFQYGLMMDNCTDEANPWYVSNSENQWEPVSEEDYKVRFDRITSQYLKLDLRPISILAN